MVEMADRETHSSVLHAQSTTWAVCVLSGLWTRPGVIWDAAPHPASPSGWQEPTQAGFFLWYISFLDLHGNWTCPISSVWCALKAFSPFKCCLWYHVSENRAHHPFEPDSLRSPGVLRLQPCLFTAHCGLQVKETDVSGERVLHATRPKPLSTLYLK